MSKSSNPVKDKYFGELPPEFSENVVRVCGGRGEAWLRELPEIVVALEDRWEIKVDHNYPGLSYNFVAPAVRRDGTPVVLKISLPVDDAEIHGEASYLRYLDGDGTVRLLDQDLELEALLLERAVPGRDLKQVFPTDPTLAVETAITVLEKLSREAPDRGNFVMLESWTVKLHDAEQYPFPCEYAHKALDIFDRSDSKHRRLLHGDFHHMNILSNGPDSFLAIDPKGIIGDLKYDIAVFLNNHRGWLKDRPDVVDFLFDALRRFSAAFEISPNEIKKWAFAQKVLGSFWTLTEGGPRWRGQLASADIWDV